MCLGIPGQVIQRLEGYGGQLALVDVSGAQRKITLECSTLISKMPSPREIGC